QGGGPGGVGQRLAAEQGNAFDGVLVAGAAEFGEQVGEGAGLAAGEGEHFRVAAAGAAQRAALEPEREAPAGAFGLGAGNGLRDLQCRPHDDPVGWAVPTTAANGGHSPPYGLYLSPDPHRPRLALGAVTLDR